MAILNMHSLIQQNTKILKSRVSKVAYQGVAIAIASVIIATVLVSYVMFEEVTVDGLIAAQKSNYALWFLDCIPFVFALWGQYSGTLIAYEAGAILIDQTEDLRRQANLFKEQAEHVSTHDALTNLPNRALFYDRVEQAILTSIRHDSRLAILLIDIDNIKQIHDTLGRNSSDLIVKQVAARLKAAISDSISLARIDSNMFCLLLNPIEEVEAPSALAETIINAMEPAFLVDQLRISVHVNIGIVDYPDHASDVDSLVQKAGIALYIAQNSISGYAVYDPSYDEHTPRRLTLMNDLKQAIETEQLQLHYQAKVELDTHLIYGVEALVRWQHPKHGSISPSEFVPQAERTRMIKPLTMWVLKRAFLDCATWHKNGVNFKVAVNLSARDLHDSEFPDVISGTVAATGVDPNWIVLEITESSVMIDPEKACDVLQRLSAMGFQISIDDYGTGYSSLAYLKKMPISELKIDRSFVTDILQSENDAVIVNATINLAHNLKIRVTAEGVEDEKILLKLAEYGCDLAQGYHINLPASIDSFNHWINDSSWKVLH